MTQTGKTAVALVGETTLGFDAALAKTREELAAEGFGILTEIDFSATMKKKLDKDLPPYVILGACHPPSAFQAFSAAPEVGVLLPCNVTVSVEAGKTVVRAMAPLSVLGLIDAPELADVGRDVSARLERVVARVSAA